MALRGFNKGACCREAKDRPNPKSGGRKGRRFRRDRYGAQQRREIDRTENKLRNFDALNDVVIG